MRRSPLRHPLAVMRTMIGLTQKEMAALVQRAPRTIQSIELGHLPLCEELALRIAEATGVDEAWLYEGDPDTPPPKGLALRQTGRGDGPYTREDYEYYRAYVETPIVTKEELATMVEQARAEGKDEVEADVAGLDKGRVLGQQVDIIQLIDRDLTLRLKMILAQTGLTKDMRLVRWKLRRFLTQMVQEFGLDVPETGVSIQALRLAGGRKAKPGNDGGNDE